MSYIILLVVIVFLFYQNGRIKRLESRIEGMGKTGMGAASEPVPVPPTQPAMSAAMDHVPVPPKKEKDISTEEASGRILGRVGIAALVIGVAFFLKYAFDNNWIGPAGRVAVGILIGVCVIALGQFLRRKYLGYSDLLIGGGLAILYLSVFSSFALYHLVDPMFAFFGLIVVTAIGVIMSIMNATEALSIIALIGGFLAPELIGVTALGPWITFTYITILNAGILGIMFYKKWSHLVIIGLVGTWIIFGTWLFGSYTVEYLIPTLLFILVQYLILTASSVIRIIVDKMKASEIDYIVLAGTAISFAWVAYYLLMPEYKHYVSLGSVMVAGLYTIIALVAYKENPSDRTLNIFLPGLAVAFLTAAVPIEFSGPWIPAWWFIESIILYIVASKSSSRGFQIMGVIVYILGLFDLMIYIFDYARPANFVIFFNAPFVMLVMAAVTAYLITFVYYRYGSITAEVQKRGVVVFVVIANVLTLYALTSQITAYYELQQAAAGATRDLTNMSNTAVSIFWALYAALLTIIGFAKRYATPRRMGLILFLITAFKVVIDVWSLGEIYRIVSFIIFGIIALAASFLYVRYRERLKNIV